MWRWFLPPIYGVFWYGKNSWVYHIKQETWWVLIMNMLLKVGNDPQKKLAGLGSHNFKSPLNWLIYVFASSPPGFFGFTVAAHVGI
jgi:hypothetical protein